MSIALHSVACCGVGAIVRIAFVVTFHELLSGEESSLVQNAREFADLDEWLRTSMSGGLQCRFDVGRCPACEFRGANVNLSGV